MARASAVRTGPAFDERPEPQQLRRPGSGGYYPRYLTSGLPRWIQTTSDSGAVTPVPAWSWRRFVASRCSADGSEEVTGAMTTDGASVPDTEIPIPVADAAAT